MADDVRPFGDLFAEPTRNGLTRPKAVRGVGVKMVNMGELFSHPRLRNAPMDRVPLSETEGERFLLANGDLLFARQSLVLEGAGKCSIFLHDTEPVTFESHVTRVRLDPEKGDPRFYFYYLQSHHGRVAIRSIVEQGAGASGIRGSDLQSLEVQWLPINEQRAIAHILGTLDDKIELSRRMNETLEAIARTFFKSWFVDFDPVRAKSEGRDPGLPEHIADLFPDSFEDSGFGEIPKEWTSTSLYGLATYVNGAAYQAFKPNGERKGLPIVKIAELKAGITSQTMFSDAQMPEKYRLCNGNILFSWSGNPDTSIDTFVWTNGPAWLNQHIFRVDLRQEEDRLFVLGILKYLRPVFAEIARNKQTTGLGHVTVGDMKRLAIVIPDDQVISAWNQHAEPIFTRIYENTLESQNLAKLRDSMLPRLLSGELSVCKAERTMENMV